MMIRSHTDSQIKLAMQTVLRNQSFSQGYESFDLTRFTNMIMTSEKCST